MGTSAGNTATIASPRRLRLRCHGTFHSFLPILSLILIYNRHSLRSLLLSLSVSPRLVAFRLFPNLASYATLSALLIRSRSLSHSGELRSMIMPATS